ncbi:MAG: CvpA family protein [Acutalibacteraceae bacterium]|jgi:uncharacterized membrane protein required for colicin V production
MIAAVILDLMILAIIGLCVLVSARRGFVRTFIEFVGMVLVILLANFASTPLANITYDKFMEPVILRTVESTMSENMEGSAKFDVSSLPEFTRRFINESDLNRFETSVKDNINNGVNTAVTNASQKMIKPLVSGILSMVYALAIFFILMFVVRILAKIANKLFSVRALGKLNSLLGGGIGALKGIIFAAIFCLFVTVILKIDKNGFWIFTQEAVQKTLLLKFLTNLLPF